MRSVVADHDGRPQVGRGRAPGSGVGVDLVTGPDVLDLVAAVVGAAPQNHTKGTPRRSAKRICLPNFSADGDTSVETPRPRSAAATCSARSRWSSAVTATSTAVGTERVAVRPRANSRPSTRVTPNEMPTPG